LLGTRERGADFQLVAHTDRGSQYTSAIYTQTLQDHGVIDRDKLRNSWKLEVALPATVTRAPRPLAVL